MTEKQMFIERLDEARDFLQAKISAAPKLGIILGSGLGGFVECLEEKINIPYGEIPHFPISTVEGHAGALVFGKIGDKPVVAMQGRFHYYEGYSMEQVTFPVRVMQRLGVKGLIVTNAAGGINTGFRPGDLVLLKDYINLIGDNPLVGPNIAELGPRFPDMSEAFDGEWRQLALSLARQFGIHPQEGIYAAMSGPAYESPAEIRFLRVIGADLVGMSTVPEVMAANHGGLRVLGISCVTNMAAGILPQRLSHAEVMETAQRIENQFVRFVRELVGELKVE